MSGQPTTTIPVLPIADLTRSVAWYERLGFTCVSTFDAYAILLFDGAELHLSESIEPPPAGESRSGAYLRVADADAVHARWSAMGAPTLAPPTDQDYGIREFATEDLDGNLWRIGSWLPSVLEAEPDPVLDPFTVTSPDPDPDPRASAPMTPSAPPPLAGHPAEPIGADELAGDVVGGTSRSDGGPGTDDEAWYGLVAGEAACAGCGMLPQDLPARALGAEVRDVTHAFGKVLVAADDDALRRRPGPETWSALEYGVHVRDLLTVFAERVIRALAETEPELGWWDHEAAIADGMANESDVSAVVDDMGRNAGKLSEALRMVTEDDWERGATRRGSERFTIELMARFALHEVRHHWDDAQRSLDAANAQR